MSSLFVRNIPTDLHQRVKKEAAARKLTLAACVTGLLREALDEQDLRLARRKLTALIHRRDVRKP